jgi:hypothetical protein
MMRAVRSVKALFLFVCVLAAPAAAQTTNPTVVEFLPSPEHGTVLSDGTAAVSRYDLVFYGERSLDAVLVTSLGKPAPQADGMIRVALESLLTAWPLPNTGAEARVVAVGPGGVAVSDVSNPFMFVCSFGLSAAGNSVPAAGGSATVDVAAGSRCGWGATSAVSWITVTGGSTGLGNGTVSYMVAANGGGARVGAVSVAGVTYTVTQAAAASVPNAPPSVHLTRPATGTTLIAGATIEVSAGATDPDGAVSRVEFFDNGTLTRTIATAPFTFMWTPAAGTHALQAVAYDNDGGSAISAVATITVSTVTFVSDLPWISMANGSGPVERDRSNGTAAAGDGQAIKIAGRTYAKGLGTAAASTVRFALAKACSRFQAEVGVDSEVKKRGSVTFEVWADGSKLYDSGVMKGGAAPRSVSVDLTGRGELALIVTDAGDGASQDHGDWGNARLTCVPEGAPALTPLPSPTPQPAPAATTYLSDTLPTSAINGWGPIERDRSNGDRASGDGSVLTLNGQAFAKGIGAHGASHVRYALNGACTALQASVGIDDAVGANGSVVFQVWADGNLLYGSGVMTGASATATVRVDLTGRQELSLVVTDGGDGNAYDHADWADARVQCQTVSAFSYLSDLTWTSAANGWGPVEKDQSNGDLATGDGGTLTLNGQTFTRGLGAHGASDIRYMLNGACSAFLARAGLDDEVGLQGSVVFQVWADGQKLFDSGVMRGDTPAASIVLDVAGRQELALIVGDGGDGNAFDHADWADARLTCTAFGQP